MRKELKMNEIALQSKMLEKEQNKLRDARKEIRDSKN